MNNKPIDKSYWKNLNPPLSPSESDVEFFKKHLIQGSTLLLGCTEKLIPLTDIQMDLDPWFEAPTVIKQNWCENNQHYKNIIGDGVFNLDKKLAHDILEMCKKNCLRFISRSFNYELPIMKVASYFPKSQDFHIKPTVCLEHETYSFFIWDFKKS